MSTKISDLIQLIEACGRAGVKKLVHETDDGLPINLEFHESKAPIELVSTVPQVKPHVNTKKQSYLEISSDFAKSEDARLLDDDFDLLPIQDPEKFEELLANGKLEHFGEAHA